MLGRRRTRGGGGSSSGSDGDGDVLNESIALGAGDLLAMLAGDSEEDESGSGGLEEEIDNNEERDIITDLHGQFVAAELNKRKRESEGASSAAGSGSGAAAPGPQACGRLIRTVTRIRKVGPEAGPLSLAVDEGSSTTITTTNPQPEKSRLAKESFVSDRVLDESAGQADVFREVEPAVAGLFEGREGVVLTYGATGSGKSHTIMGAGLGSDGSRGEGVGFVGEGDGILPRALERMYQLSGEISSSGLVISVRAFEVYNNKLYDLLNEGVQRGQQLHIQQGGDGKDVIQGFREEFPPNLAEALACAKSARARAQVNRTNLNENSSRGHVIFVLGIHRGGGSGACKSAPGTSTDLYVCDLAGPERQHRAALVGDSSCNSVLREIEAKEINLDITELFRRWKVVRDGAKSVIVRGRVLTRVLKSLFVRPSGAGGVNCVMLVCLNPAESEYQETNKVLKNLLISSKVKAVVEERRRPPSVPTHKRLKRSPRSAGVAGGSANQSATASARGRGGGKGKAEVGQASGSAGEQKLVDQLREEIQRLLDEKATMEEEHEFQLYEAEKRAREEEHGAMQDLEDEVADLRQQLRQLKERLQNKSPVGEGARKAAAQSAMKLQAKRAESVMKMERETTREADAEAARQADERARVEEALAAALDEQRTLESRAEREKVRADAAEADVARLRGDRSDERSARLELESKVEQLEASAALASDRQGGLERQLKAAQEEISRLESERSTQAAAAATTAAESKSAGRSSSSSSSSRASSSSVGAGSEGCDDDGGLLEGQGQEISMVSVVDDSTADDLSSSSFGSPIGEHDQQDTEEEETAAEATSASRTVEESPCGDDGAGEGDNKAEAELAAEKQESPAVAVPNAKTRGRRRIGQVQQQHETAQMDAPGGPRRSKRTDRKPLGNLQNGATPAHEKGGKGGKGGRKKGTGGVDENTEAAAVVEKDEEEEDCVMEKLSTRAMAEQQKAKRAAEKRETRRCQEMRRNQRLSKPSPDVAVLSEEQARNVDIGRKIVRERRRRGARR